MSSSVPTVIKENKGLILFILLMCVFRSAIADWNTVPTGSMKPTILEGDRILVNKLAYDIQVPFLYDSLYKLSDPLRGDIIVFNSAVSNNRLVKRVIGVPGDIIKMENNVLYINGRALDYENISTTLASVDKVESLLGVDHEIRINHAGSKASSFEEISVPEGYYLALGDNRDDSIDSRYIGFVPRDEIIGRTKKVVISLNYDNYYLPRTDRFWQVL